MSLNTHTACSHIGTQQPRAVAGGLLPSLDVFVGEVFKHQRIGIPEEAGIRGVAGNLIIEEQTPVVAVGHSEFTVGECEPVQHLRLHLLIMMHQRVGLPFLLAIEFLLEQFQGEGRLTQFLHDHILIRCVEIVMVLQCIVVVEILPFIELCYGL